MTLTVPDFLVPNIGKRKGKAKEEVGTNGSSKAASKVKGRNGKSSDSSSALMMQTDDATSAAGTSTSQRTQTAFPESGNHNSSSSSSTLKYSPLKSSKRNHDIATPYALHHDQIVTALIDDALRNNRKDEGGNAQHQPASPPSVPVDDFKSDSNDNNNNNDSTNNNHNLRTSPHRIKRSGIGGVSSNSSPSIHLLRKRQRSNSNDKLNNPGTPPLPAKMRMMRSTSSSSNILSDPSEFLHPDCILQKKKGSETNKLKRKLSFTLSSSTIGSSNNSNGDAPSAIGREETILKLQQKLSMLSDIESGKYGMAVEMLRSDAVAFIAHHPASSSPSRVATKVETRSILTLRMGFVSMSYGILLQWDCGTRLVELIVLRKMCRDDFLNGANNDDTSSSTIRDQSSLLLSGLKSDTQLAEANNHHPSLPELIPAPLLDSSTAGGTSSREVGIQGSVASSDHQEGSALPRLIHPPNPLAYLPRFLGSGSGSGGGSSGNSAAATNNTKSQYLLSVSALNVTQLHSGCEHCRAERKQSPTSATIRPYIRFALGEYEHCTRVTKFSNGNATWTKRHHNSCLLPCRPEEFRWFAGREDLTVEVRNEWKLSSGSGNDSQHAPLWPSTRLLFGAQNDENHASSIANHPILAAVTVPLSSVNIEDEESIGLGRGAWRRRGKPKEGPSSTKITIPLRMNCCQSAPIGSITLRITIKATTPGDRGIGEGGGDGGVNFSSNNLYGLAKPNIQIDISVSGDGANGEPKVSESIELGPLTRLMDGWSLGGGGGVREVETKKERKKKGRKAAKSTVVQQENKSTFAWPEILPPLDHNNNNSEGEKKRTSINWSKRLDHQTKKWSALKLNRTESSNVSDDADVGWFTFLRGGTRETVENRKTL